MNIGSYQTMKKENILGFFGKYKWILLVIVVIVWSFYWFELRLANARIECTKTASEHTSKVVGSTGLMSEYTNTYNLLYKVCLSKKGL